MTQIFHSIFDSDTDGFTGGTWVNTAGSAAIGDAAGALQVGAGVTAYRDFTNITTGKSKLSIWCKFTDTTTSASTASLFYLLANGETVSSGNSIATIALDSSSPAGGTSTHITLYYRNTSGTFSPFLASGTVMTLRRGAYWYKFSVVCDHTAETVDIYLDDVLWVKAIPWVNGAATGFGRVAMIGSASAPDRWFDNIVVEDSWSEGESVIVDHDFVGASGEIEASTPTTATRGAHGQPWMIPQNTTDHGGFTLGANGAAPDATQDCIALTRCGANGIIECEFQSASSGNVYFGLAFRFWDYFSATGAGGGLFRIYGGASNTAVLYLPDRAGALQTVQSSSLTPSANTTYTLKVEMRGRYLICSYKAAAMDSGSYTVLWTHAITSSATGGRGMLIEELAGPFIDTDIGSTTNYVRRFRFTGKADDNEVTDTVGSFKYEIERGSIKAIYALGAAATTRNLFWSRGIQYSHRSSADLCGQHQQQAIYDTTNVRALRQTGSNVTEYQHIGFGDAYVTLLRRGPWISDGITVADNSENWAPDLDLRPELWDKQFRTCINTGSGALDDDTTYHDWTAHESSVTLPAGNQSLTTFGSGQEYLMTQVVLADGTVPTAAWGVTSKYEGTGDPISRAFSPSGASMTVGNSYRTARGFLLRAASALSDTVLTEFRDALASPGTLTSFVSGSLKTDAAGDTNTDGFNERHGWYEITCAGGVAAWTLPVASGTRHMPSFRLHSWTNTNTALSIAGSPATEGTDYVIDEVASGVAVLQLLGDYTASTALVISATANAFNPAWARGRNALISAGAMA